MPYVRTTVSPLLLLLMLCGVTTLTHQLPSPLRCCFFLLLQAKRQHHMPTPPRLLLLLLLLLLGATAITAPLSIRQFRPL
jgi:hypothetical protein